MKVKVKIAFMNGILFGVCENGTVRKLIFEGEYYFVFLFLGMLNFNYNLIFGLIQRLTGRLFFIF